MSRTTLSFALLAALALTPTFAHAAEMQFKATMNGASEVPPKTTEGKGTATATLDTVTKKLTYNVTYSGLSGPATAAHIHGPAAAGANAGVLFPFAPPTSPISGSVTMTDAQIADLEAGKMYVNVHTATNPGGEIRGQLTK
jgi:hypothetical protein